MSEYEWRKIKRFQILGNVKISRAEIGGNRRLDFRIDFDLIATIKPVPKSFFFFLRFIFILRINPVISGFYLQVLSCISA